MSNPGSQPNESEKQKNNKIKEQPCKTREKGYPESGQIVCRTGHILEPSAFN